MCVQLAAPPPHPHPGLEDGVFTILDGQSSPTFFRSPHPRTHTCLFWWKKDQVTIPKSLWVHFLCCVPITLPVARSTSFPRRERASLRAGALGYRGPAHAAPQLPLVAAARVSPALSARRSQWFPRFLPPACDPRAAGTAGRAGTASFASIVSLRSPLPPAPLL